MDEKLNLVLCSRTAKEFTFDSESSVQDCASAVRREELEDKYSQFNLTENIQRIKSQIEKLQYRSKVTPY